MMDVQNRQEIVSRYAAVLRDEKVIQQFIQVAKEMRAARNRNSYTKALENFLRLYSRYYDRYLTAVPASAFDKIRELTALRRAIRITRNIDILTCQRLGLTPVEPYLDERDMIYNQERAAAIGKEKNLRKKGIRLSQEEYAKRYRPTEDYGANLKFQKELIDRLSRTRRKPKKPPK